MEVYKAETREILRRYLRNEIAYADCVVALDAALTGLLPRMHPKDVEEAQSIAAANNHVLAELRRQHAGHTVQ